MKRYDPKEFKTAHIGLALRLGQWFGTIMAMLIVMAILLGLFYLVLVLIRAIGGL